jgi:YspA, cpYpsA-related SLOG family
MNVLVCGGREYGQLVEEEKRLFAVLDAQQALAPISLIIQGGARGADAMARLWAEARAIDCLTVPAKWDLHGRGAGPIRNARMLDYNPILVIAFPGGRGTENMCVQAKRSGVKVVRVAP